MENLIKIEKSQGGKSVVSARELHAKLEIETPYNIWFPRMIEYGFVENQDYILVLQKCYTNNPKNPTTERTDAAITLDMAKQICMIQRTDIGRKFREYFIQCEKQLTALNLPSYQIDDPIARAQKWIEEQRQAQVAIIAKETKIIEQQHKIDTDAPKVFFADAVSASGCISVAELAKMLKQNGYETGEIRFFRQLRKDGFLCINNIPTQRAMELKLFEIKETTITTPDGITKITKTPKITGKGQLYFINHYCKTTTK